MTIPMDARLNDFAVRCFRDNADGDYIAARMACRAALLPQFLWSSQQAIEKYLKCILLLNRVKATNVKHDLAKALKLVVDSGRVSLDLCTPSLKFIDYLDNYGRFRYLEISHWGQGTDLLVLDRAVWEVRQFCTLRKEPAPIKVIEGVPTPHVRLPGGYLEKILDGRRGTEVARAALVWQNGFFGTRKRRFVRIGGWLHSTNSPLTNAPEILDEVLRYVFLPSDVVRAYREYRDDLRRKKGDAS